MTIFRRLQLSAVAAIAACLTFATPALAQLQWNYSTNAQGNAQATYPGTVVIGAGSGCSGAPATLCADNLSPGVVHVPSVPAGSVNQGGLSVGTLNFMDTGMAASWQGSINGYLQTVVQNTNSGAAASGDYVVCNNLCTATTYYGDFGINSSGYTGSGSFNLPNATYLFSVTGDLSIGTYSSNAIHFVINNSATDACTISTGSVFSCANAIPITSGGTGSNTQNFVDLTTTQASIAGVKTFTGQLIGKGTATNDNAASGYIGEFISSNVPVGSAISLTSGTPVNVTSISLTAGDWDVWGVVDTNAAGTTVQANVYGGIGTTSATIPTAPNGGAVASQFPSNFGGANILLPVGIMRASISATTTYYLTCNSSFTVSTNSCYGFIGALRVR